MIALKQKYGSLALVAGASEGIGEAFSHYLAAEGMDIVIIARRKEPLQKLANLLIEKYKIKADWITCDLSEYDAVDKIKESLYGKEIDLLVYNAALSHIGPFENLAVEQNNLIVKTNVITPMKMVQVFGEEMLIRNRGAIIIMSSLAGFQGSGFLTTYASTKAFSRVFAESLWYEWKNRGVDVIACCAGATSTPNFINTKPEKPGFLAPRVQNPDEVVKECFKMLGKKPSCITGRGNRIASFIMQKIFSRKMAINIMGDNTKKMYRLDKK